MKKRKSNRKFSVVAVLILKSRAVMALIRGLNGDFPCPVCLVPANKLSDQSVRYPLRDAAQSRELVLHARGLNSGQREVALRSQSLRNVDNAFWPLLPRINLHQALSFDMLHTFDGFFHDHLLPEFKKYLARSPDTRAITDSLDER